MILVRHKDNKLRREIIIALVLKIIIIWCLWLAFFSEPLDDGLSSAGVAEVLLGNPTGGYHSQQAAVNSKEE
jgi:hypothetical protein